ncbi:hypothetical protein BH23CYA1_BH23CYA1_05160 [soil metagenome]
MHSYACAPLCPLYTRVPTITCVVSKAANAIDSGIPNDEWITGGLAYNTIGDTVEWRIHIGQPVAIILRYNFMDDGFMDDGFMDDGIDPTSWSELAVTSIGQAGSPGD